MFMLLKHYHEEFVPDNLLEFVPDKSPAIMAYFCTLHGGNRTTSRLMKKTSTLCCEKLYEDFRKDFIPVFEKIAESNSFLFDKLISIASATLKFGEIGDLGVWKPLLETLLRYEKTENNEIVVSFAGYYGSLIMRSVVLNGGAYKLNKDLYMPNNQPMPAIWSTITLIHSVLELKSFECRFKANVLSEQIFSKSGVFINDVNDWDEYSVYTYFYDVKGKGEIKTSKTPYLELLRLIRNKVCHMRSLFLNVCAVKNENICAVKNEMPSCLFEWTRTLLIFLKKKNTD
jgi:hypothetical protein